MIWTTTPWTIPVNQAIAYGADVEYGLFRMVKSGHIQFDNFQSGQSTIVTVDRNIVVANDKLLLIEIRQRLKESGYSIHPVQTFKGSDLAGTIARHPMAKLFENPSPLAGEERDLARNELSRSGVGASAGAENNGVQTHADPTPGPSGHPLPQGERGYDPASPLAEFFLRPRPFLDGSAFVTTETGTGLVHMSPDHGEDDFDLCKANGIDPVFAVEGDGKYRADWGWLGGQGSVINPKFNAPDGPICSDLREAGGLLAASADYKHSYPHSVALQSQGHLSLHPAMVCADG